MISKIIDLDFGNQESNADVIERLFDTIEYYRDKKKTVREIYHALHRQGQVKMAYQTFRNFYYARRRKIKSTTSSSFDSTESSSHHSQSPEGKHTSVISSPLENDDFIAVDDDDSQSQSSSGKTMTLDEKRAISAEIFRQKSS